MEKHITFDANDITLEGLHFEGDPHRAAVVMHPHPLYGGDMHNAVVQTIANVYQQRNWTTLRFNFRGTGRSGGTYNNGIGERDDLDGAVSHLRSLGIDQIDLVGYSFGAWVLAEWAQDHTSHGCRIMLIAPPVAFVEFSDGGAIAGLQAVIVGNLDGFAPVEGVRAHLANWSDGIELSIISHADHFFSGHMPNLEQAIGDHLD